MRLFVGALVVCLALAPAVVRATRVLDPSGGPSIALSFKTLFDVPPDAADMPPDVVVEPVALVPGPLPTPPSAWATPAPVRAADSLRGPPVAVGA